MKNKNIVIIGQTASGKTALAHALFDSLKEKNIQSEIVNLDAFQIYKDVSVGTSKPNQEEQIKYHYHCIDLCFANESMDANTFATLLQDACKKIREKGAIPICVGGSGLYLRAFLHGLDNIPPKNETIRQEIRNYAHQHGWEKCYERLLNVDPVRAKELHPNDHMRIERALEIFELTQMPASELQTKKEPLHTQNTISDSFVIHTAITKDELRHNIVLRTNELFEKGWFLEVKNLYQKYGEEIWKLNAMRAIGYQSVLKYILESCDINSSDESLFLELKPSSELIEQIVTETMQYAKRQKTWNKKEKMDFEIHPQNKDEIFTLCKKLD